MQLKPNSVKIKSVVFFIIILFLTFSCKSVQFKEKSDEANQEISLLLREIQDVTEKKLALTYSFIKIASAMNYATDELLFDVNEIRTELSELNISLNEKRLSKRNIRKYFHKKYEFSKQLKCFITELDNSISENQNYITLRNTFETNENLLDKIIKEYNATVEKNSEFVNYPKFELE